MKRWGFGWTAGLAVVAVMGFGACGDDDKTPGKDGDAATETAEVTGDSAVDVEPDTATDTLDTSVATETTPADSQQDSAIDTTEPADTAADTTEPVDTAPETVADTTEPVDTAPETVADTSVPVDTAETAEVDPGLVTWDDVYPIFSTSCTPCHAGNTATSGSGGHSIASANKAVAYTASQRNSNHCPGKKIGECALERIQDGSMPASGECQDPVKPKCPDQDEQALIQQWIADGMLEK